MKLNHFISRLHYDSLNFLTGRFAAGTFCVKLLDVYVILLTGHGSRLPKLHPNQLHRPLHSTVSSIPFLKTKVYINVLVAGSPVDTFALLNLASRRTLFGMFLLLLYIVNLSFSADRTGVQFICHRCFTGSKGHSEKVLYLRQLTGLNVYILTACLPTMV